MSCNRLEGKIAVVTAAAQGIGRAVAERLKSEGAFVHASDLNGASLKELSGMETSVLDATDFVAVQDYFMRFDRVDILVHAVGYVHQGTIEECSPDDWRRSQSITLDSAYNVLAAGVPKMRSNGGSIITIASVASSLKGFPKRVAYCAAKGGVIGLTKAVAADYVAEGIRCNAVCPGTVDTPSFRTRIAELSQEFGSEEKAWEFFNRRQPSGRLGTADEVAAAVAFLASDEASLFTGQTIHSDGGITI
ncbi:2-keto-3-deoxy-L-fuconate dehydrogenase [Shimia isoporae]|uniref:2-keto-3-deoxy-L-fuconate dehydrogenase n=1 Tax=Shimia isoporae TaxID=647720 RepID=A0A4R1N495_9RHOB|nr:SDR family oxidoreductase [Shimia isoporae]TCL00563.1 2-keto-3-deoxy-L-fuconate dehydrogenase [Shimia isoporae]